MRVQCQICGVNFSRISYTHLAMHNVTPEEYEEKYGARSIRAGVALQKIGGNSFLQAVNEQNPKEVAEIILNDQRVFRNADRKIFIDRMRDTMDAIYRQYAVCQNVMTSFLSQLAEPWAFSQSEDGTPITPLEKAQLMRAVSGYMRDINSFQSRLTQQMLYDNHTHAMRKVNEQNLHGAFIGTEDKIPAIPDTMSPYQREKIRLFLEAWQKTQVQLPPAEQLAKKEEPSGNNGL